MKKLLLLSTAVALLSSCSSWREGDGQIVYHWERPRTGVEKFSRDHNYCMREAEAIKLMPRFATLFHSMFYSEEEKLMVRADWHSDRGIWATYVPYTGAQPLIVNYLRDDSEINPADYSKCMRDKGYTTRTYDIPEITNIRLHGRSSI